MPLFSPARSPPRSVKTCMPHCVDHWKWLHPHTASTHPSCTRRHSRPLVDGGPSLLRTLELTTEKCEKFMTHVLHGTAACRIIRRDLSEEASPIQVTPIRKHERLPPHRGVCAYHRIFKYIFSVAPGCAVFRCPIIIEYHPILGHSLGAASPDQQHLQQRMWGAYHLCQPRQRYPHPVHGLEKLVQLPPLWQA